MNRGLSLVQKIVGGFALIILLFFGIGTYLYFSLQASVSSVSKLSDSTIPSLLSANLIARDIMEIRNIVYQHIVGKDPTQMDMLEGRRKELMDQLKKEVQNFKENFIRTDDDESVYQTLVKSLISYQVQEDKILNYSRQTFVEEALTQLQGPAEVKYKALKETIDTFLENSRKGAVDEVSVTKNNADSAALFLFVGMAGTLILAVLLSAFLSISLSRRFKLFVSHFQQGASGDLTSRLKGLGYDELGLMGKNFNQLIESLATVVGTLKKIAESSKGHGVVLSQSSVELSATTEEMDATMNQILRRFTTLKQEIEKAFASMETIGTIISRSVSHLELQASSVSRSSSAVEEMAASIRNINATTKTKKVLTDELAILAKTGESDMEETLNAIVEIAKATEVISEFNEVINGVASQTGLLAMNAAIEAAHAGDAGKGFSVVAEEIRKLSDATTINAKSISESLRSVIARIEETRSTSSRTGATISRLLTGIQDISASMNEIQATIAETTTGSEEITKSLVELVSITDEIKASGQAMQEQSAKTKTAMQEVLEMAEVSQIAVTETSQGITEIAKSVNLLAQISQENADNTASLEMEMAKFKTQVN